MTAADMPTIFLFILAGLLVGTVVLGLLAVLATAGAVLWIVGEMN